MLTWIRDVLSSKSCASFARCSTALTVLTGCYCLIHLVRHNDALPDAATLIGLGAWMVSPYAINKAAAAWGSNPDQKDGTGAGL